MSQPMTETLRLASGDPSSWLHSQVALAEDEASGATGNDLSPLSAPIVVPACGDGCGEGQIDRDKEQWEAVFMDELAHA